MRYIVIRKDGSILCNVPERDRAISISQHCPGSSIVVTNKGLHQGFLIQCARYGWTLENDAKHAEDYNRWLQSPVYGRGK